MAGEDSDDTSRREDSQELRLRSSPRANQILDTTQANRAAVNTIMRDAGEAPEGKSGDRLKDLTGTENRRTS